MTQPGPGASPEDTPVDVRAVSEHIERVLDDLAGVADERVAERAEELVRTLMSFYEVGLSRMLELLREQAGSNCDGEQLIADLGADDIVGGLFALHDLHPKSTHERVTEALDTVRPYLGSHAGDVDLLGIDDSGVVRLQLQGTCDGCPSSTVTVKYAIEKAINEAAPEITDIDVAGIAEQPAQTDPGGRTMLPLEAVDSRSTLECPVPEAP